MQGVAVGIATGNPLRGAGAAAGAAITALSPLAGPAAPFVAAAGAVVSLMSSLFQGCGQTCVAATQIANQAQTQLASLRDQFLALPVKYLSAQQAFLAAFDQVAAQMQQACSNPALGAAGQRCISERLVRGGTAPWCPNPGHVGCDWITTLRDPIANYTPIVDDSVTGQVTSALQSLIGGGSSTSGDTGVLSPGLLIPLGLILLGVLL